MNKENISYLLYATIGFATLSLVFGFFLSRYPSISVIVAALGIMGGLASRKSQPWIKNTMFVLMILMTILAALLGLNRYLLLINTIFTLAAWDLSYFTSTLKRADSLPKETDLIATHLQRLAIVSFSGLFLALISLLLELEFSFGWALLLGLVLIISLSRSIGLVRQNSLQ